VSEWKVIQGDCIEVMRGMESDSIDAVVCDPPYGLEFMGKEWDRLDGGLPQEAQWKGRRGAGGSKVGADDSRPGSRHHVGLGGQRSRFRRCVTCGRREFSGTPCRCESPEWVYETPAGAPSSMIRMQRWHYAWAVEALRVLKPGGHLLAFGGTRTYHRLTCAIEDAGFEIRDSVHWIYGSGFPKSLDISKALVKSLGERREQVKTPFGNPDAGVMVREGNERPWFDEAKARGYHEHDGPVPISPEAQQWAGYGTALKPAHEPIVVARKPLSESSVVANVLKHGTGGINVDGCRVSTNGETVHAPQSDPTRRSGVVGVDLGISRADKDRFRAAQAESAERTNRLGRWPPNVLLTHHPDCVEVGAAEVGYAVNADRQGEATSEKRYTEVGGTNIGATPGQRRGKETVTTWRCVNGCPVAELDAQTGTLKSGKMLAGTQRSTGGGYHGNFPGMATLVDTPGDAGGASRFFPVFKYQAKAGKKERRGSKHPTVKPVALMRWLVRLVTAEGQLVLDPFTGSGTTLEAAILEGRNVIGIEKEAEYIEDIYERMASIRCQLEVAV